MSKVYLAGAIAGLTEGEATDWRTYFSGLIAPHGLIGVSPLRCEKCEGIKFEDADTLNYALKKEIFAKNLFDVKHCDMTLAYLPLPKPGQRPSYGTMWEVGAARALGKLVMIVSDDPIIRGHPLFGGTADWTLDTLEQAAERATAILGVYTDLHYVEKICEPRWRSRDRGY